MTIEAVLDRSVGVRQTSPDSWSANCQGPTHANGDRSASMLIRVLSDGKVLVHCFAGCTAGEIVESLGLRLMDLYPMREERHPPRGPYRSTATRWQGPSASEALKALAFESQFVAIVANDLAAGKELEEDDRARLWTAVGRIGQAKEFCCRG